ncbi:hypothetical protein N9A28_05530 [Sulfurimonas sp.]|nr:hypothetical protein [Sulfurimonas sp.]
MFISTYNTYINTNTSDKSIKDRFDHQKDSAQTFKSQLAKSTIAQPKTLNNLPVDYVSNNKSFQVQHKLQEQTKNSFEVKFQKVNAMKSAAAAYIENTTMFSYMKKPSSPIAKANKEDLYSPQNIQEIKEEKLRFTMINTYISNDKYYQITA